MTKHLDRENGRRGGNRDIIALSIGLIAAKQLFPYTNGIKTGWNFRKAVQYLQDQWNIIHTISALNMLEYLKYEGERTAYNILLPSLLAGNDRQSRRLLLEKRHLTVDRLIHYSDNLSECLIALQENKVISINASDLERGILAWDMVQIILIAQISFDAYYLTEEETWEHIYFAYESCQKAFNDWEELGKSYIIGEAMHSGDNLFFRKSLDLLTETLTEENSIWSKNGFKHKETNQNDPISPD